MGASFTSKTRNWRFYQDDGSEPTTAYANENTAVDITGSLSTIFRLRFNIAETTGGSSSNALIQIEWSTDQTNWNTPGSASAWNYGSGQGTHGNNVTSFKLTDTSTYGEYVTTSGGRMTIAENSNNEFDFALTPGSAFSAGTTYYFRAYVVNTGIDADTSETYPQLKLSEEAASPTPTITQTPSKTPSLSVSSTQTPTQTPSLSILATPSLSISSTQTPSLSISATPSLSISSTQTPTQTPSLSISSTPSLSISSTQTPSRTPTIPGDSPSVTPTRTPSLSISSTQTPSITISITPSLSISRTRTPSLTPTLSISKTPSVTPSEGTLYSNWVLKYSTTEVPNTTKSKNMVFGYHGDVEWGPTITSGFWNGFNPPAGGYTIYYLTETRQEPVIYVAHNDNECIFLAKQFGGVGINTINDAITYFSVTNSDTNIFDENGLIT